MSDINNPLRALEAHGWVAPVLYTDEINGQRVMRDDVWLCTTAALKAAPQPAAPMKRLTNAQIEAGRHDTFSTGNPFCPCTDKTMLKAVRWAERALAKANGMKLEDTQ